MCGSSHSSSSNAEQGLAKLAGITPVKSFGEFKVGDRATGLGSRGSESSRATGVIIDFESGYGGGNSIANLSLDSGGTRKVWSDTLAPVSPAQKEFQVGDRVTGYEHDGVVVTGTIARIDHRGDGLGVELKLDSTHNFRDTWWVKYSSLQPVVTEFKVGDYVTGWDDPDKDDDYGSNYVGEIIRIDSKDGQNVELRDGNNDTFWVYYSTLSKAERPVAPVLVEAGPALTAGTAPTIVSSEPVPAPVPAAPQYPVEGSVDFNKELFGTNENLSEIKVVAHVPGADYPFVVSYRGAYGGTSVGTYDSDGYHADDSDLNLRNAHELPDVVYIVIYRDTDNDDQLGVLKEVFDSERSAKGAYLDENNSLVGILPVHPKELDAKRIADLAAEAAVSAASNDDSEGADAAAGVDVNDTSGGLSEISLSITGSGYTRLVPGQVIWAERRGFGRRKGKIVKIRNDRNKQILFQPDDGSNRYYALNKNLRLSG